MAQTQSTGGQLLWLLEGRPCPYCDDGTLDRDTYKGTDAVVCEQCGDLVARIFTDGA